MISLKTFTGEVPRSAAHLLPDNAAQSATDCDFTANTLTGLNGFGNPISTGQTGLKSVFFYGSSRSGDLRVRPFFWKTDADVVRGPVASDAFDRMYWTAAPSYELMVTQSALLGVSSPPDPNKTYRAGVPAPLSAVQIGAVGLTYNGAALTDIVAVCETPSGSVISAESLLGKGSITSNNASGIHAAFSYSPQCRLYSPNALSTSAAATLPAGFTPDGNVNVYFKAPVATGQYTRSSPFLFRQKNEQQIYTPDSGSFDTLRFSYNGAKYIRYADWEYAPLGDVLWTLDIARTITSTDGSIMSGLVSTTEGVLVNPTIYYSIGSGWYCTAASAKPPTGSDKNGATFAVRLYFGNYYVTLRESAARSSIDMPGYAGEFSLQGSNLAVDFRVTASSGANVEQRSYVMTYVNIFGEESAPSPAAEISVAEGHSLSLSMRGLTSTPYAPISKIRLYRTATGSSSTDFLFVREFDNASTVTFSDSMRAAELGEPISTLGYLPPESGLRGLIALPNGIFAAFKNNEIHFSEPYLPYAWKPDNILTTADAVVGLCAADGGFYVTTRSNPYFVSGVTPDAMGQMKLTSIQAGVSKGSICNIGPAVIWASNDGLVTANGGNASLDWSFKFFTRNDWRKRFGDRLNLMRLNAHDGHLLVWFEDGSPGFLMRYDEVEPSLTKLARGVYAAAVHPQSDDLYVCLNGSEMVPFKNQKAARRAFAWTSKAFVHPKPISYGAVQVVGSGSVTVKVYADGQLRSEKTLTLDDRGFSVYRLPSGSLSRTWTVELAGAGEVTEFNLAVSPMEFANG